ncbi:MAG: glycosyltransferase family 2 protein [Armatimonadota bacterium]
MDLSVCLVNWNTRDHLARCLTALRGELTGLDAEVLVVDNASTDGSADLVRSQFPQVTLIANRENLYYSAANNQALTRAQGEFVLLLNPDVELRPRAVAAMLRVLREREAAGAVACRLLLPDGSIQLSCRSFPTPAVLAWEALGLSRLFPRSRRFGAYRMSCWDYDDTRQVDQPMASCLMLRKRALDEVGHFDEGFPMFFNDVDLCYRLKAAGWEVYFTPEGEALHHHAASTSQVWPEMVRQSNQGLLRFYRKHYRGRISRPAYAVGVLLIRLGGAVRLLGAGLRRTSCSQR